MLNKNIKYNSQKDGAALFRISVALHNHNPGTFCKFSEYLRVIECQIHTVYYIFTFFLFSGHDNKII